MKNNITRALLFSWIVIFSGITVLSAQERKVAKANKNYESLDYVDAQKIYLAVAEKGYASEELFGKLGNSYYFNAQYDDAVLWYGKLFGLNPQPQEPLLFLRYSQALKATGDNGGAKEYYDSYIEKMGTDPYKRTAVDYLELIQQNSGRYGLQAVQGIYDENKISFGHTILNNKLIYASTAETESFGNRKSAWDGLSFLSLYEVEMDSLNVAIGKPRKLKGELDSKFHESSPIYTKDGKTMYFTRSNTTSKSKKNDQKLKIYRSKLEEGKWQEAEELNFNSDTFSSAHPALNADGTKLYFSSDRPGGMGESDLYVSTVSEDGEIGPPKNLGKSINTGGRETFPFISSEGELYFSSDGHFGLGGLDVFYVKIKEEGFGNLLNVGEPINSFADDFAFGMDQTTKRGFISSNRTETKGEFVYDNIYSFLETAPIKDVYMAMIEGKITDTQTGQPLENTLISLRDINGNIYAETKTDVKGHYQMETNKFVTYTIKAEREGYDTAEKISTANLVSQQIDFELQPNRVAIETGTDLSKVLNIPLIYFDFDKAEIRPDAKVELEKIVAALEAYPQLKLNIRSHTDSRGTDNYNQALSERRAKSTFDYLVSKGIDSGRLKYEGRGESELVNACSNCTEEEHQKNRRSEFIVLD